MVSSLRTWKDWIKRPQSYSALTWPSPEKVQRHSDDDASKSESSESGLLEDDLQFAGRYSPRKLSYPAIILTGIAVSLIAIVAFFVGKTWQPDLDRTCMRHTSTYSTAMDEVSNKLHDTKFNGTLGLNSEFSGHWGDPNDEMDSHWYKWGFVKMASFTPEEWKKMGKDMEGTARFTEEYGGGYMGFLEVNHQMHCLNVIRQAYHWDYYAKPENSRWAEWMLDRPITVKVHINHCFEMLRQLIMCNADMGVISHHWVKDIQDPYADFNQVHKCRDIDSVEKWINEHEARPPPETGYPMPADAVVWPSPP
ncbi:hypothetical protein F4860DRAFT_462515 [Xylaria cubensis]|nr:hypothetical protein F4860DRAFT_462515 [Xylaria cubensis]